MSVTSGPTMASDPASGAIRLAAAPITSMYSTVSMCLDPEIVWIRMTNAMRTEAFHDPPVTAPVLLPGHHVMITGLVDATELPSALARSMSGENGPTV